MRWQSTSPPRYSIVYYTIRSKHDNVLSDFVALSHIQ